MRLEHYFKVGGYVRYKSTYYYIIIIIKAFTVEKVCNQARSFICLANVSNSSSQNV